MSDTSRGNKIGLCPKCFEAGHLTAHHVLPKRYFGQNKHKLYLCRSCHNEIEATLPSWKMKRGNYFKIHKAWLRDQPIVVVDSKKHKRLIRERRMNIDESRLD